ncbi:unnamed protein product, partial [Tetraodon nigroviridis]
PPQTSPDLLLTLFRSPPAPQTSSDLLLCFQKGNSALHISSLAGQLAVVKVLVKRGADINRAVAERLHPPLHARPRRTTWRWCASCWRTEATRAPPPR